MKILPGDFTFLTDNGFIRTKCPPDLIDNKMIAARCHAVNLAAGDHVIVQCFDHAGEVLLAESEWTVIGKVERKKTTQFDDISSRSFMERNYEVEQRGDWWVPASLTEPEPVQVIPQRTEAYIPADSHRIWNPGTRTHEVRRRDTDALVCTHTDKETAERIAAGELPLPELVA